MLRDARSTFSPFGQLVLAASSVGEFGSILLLALFYSESSSGFGSQLTLLIGFAILLVVIALALTRTVGANEL